MGDYPRITRGLSTNNTNSRESEKETGTLILRSLESRIEMGIPGAYTHRVWSRRTANKQ